MIGVQRRSCYRRIIDAPIMNSQKTPEVRLAHERIVTNWRRFSMGLWRVPSGDINDAYSAETMPKVRAFIHDGRWFTNGGTCHSRLIHSEVDAYRLIPVDEYHGVETVPYSYEGRQVTCQKKTFRLGAKVIFVTSDPTVDEWRRLLRSIFGDGGWFVAGCTYPEFLSGDHAPDTQNGRLAVTQELAACASGLLPRDKLEMCRWLDAGSKALPPAFQLDLPL